MPLPEDLSEGERVVGRLLSTDTPRHIDELAALSKLTLTESSGVLLLALEMRELIRQLPGQSFVRRL